MVVENDSRNGDGNGLYTFHIHHFSSQNAPKNTNMMKFSKNISTVVVMETGCNGIYCTLYVVGIPWMQNIKSQC